MDPLVKRPLREAAIGAGDDIFTAHQFRLPRNPLGHQFRMFDDIGGVADDPGDQHFTFGQFDVLPHPPFMFVPGIGALDDVGAGVHR